MSAALQLAFAAHFLVTGARVIEVEFVPSGKPQIAIWIEDARGGFVDTIMVTQLVGTYGLGNRPGRGDFGSGYLWPYGRREMTLPVWAHRRGVEYDRLVFQDCHENAIRYHNPTSSEDRFYCRPTTAQETMIDAITCPTSHFDSCKGMPLRLVNPNGGPECAEMLANLSMKSFYPPRNDLARVRAGYDWDGVADFAAINDLDAVSAATPPENRLYRARWTLPDALAPGDYVVWIEVSEEGDFNESYNLDFFPDPAMTHYGVPFQGQPSIVWRTAITAGDAAVESSVEEYAGYGSIDGADGDVRPPDATIARGVPGSGAERLARVRVRFDPNASCATLLPVEDLRTTTVTSTSIALAFTSVEGAASYEVRWAKATRPLDEAELATASRLDVVSSPVLLDRLSPSTSYAIAVRAIAACGAGSEVRSVVVATAGGAPGVDACFIATAAYGSKDEPHVAELRRFRDRVFMKSEPGRALVELYYQVSPDLAAIIRDHEILRFGARALLTPLVRELRDVP